MWNHLPRMGAAMRDAGIQPPRLTPLEFSSLAAFLFTTQYYEASGDPVKGSRLFTAKSCAQCHAVGGKGGSVGPALDGFKRSSSPVLMAAAMWNHGPRMAEAMNARGITWPTFRRNGAGRSRRLHRHGGAGPGRGDRAGRPGHARARREALCGPGLRHVPPRRRREEPDPGSAPRHPGSSRERRRVRRSHVEPRREDVGRHETARPHACLGSRDRRWPTSRPTSTPRTTSSPPPAGQDAVESSSGQKGCLACHAIYRKGGNGAS